MARFVLTDNYNAALERIEDHILLTTGSLEHVEKFLAEHDRALTFIGQNPNTAAVHPVTGDQSWIFGDGRYRLFFKCVTRSGEPIVFLIHLIDNREANLDVYPANKIPTYEEE
ncbi:MAG: hypothetical protein HY537_13470 [Deltaproteobacteria bacterium]|nr:hypothetical protein [Deltaproteobacteria bacterium]